ncbi:nascent polypeptide-associated complex subunit alpha, muscle-specific form-like isoform X2 [Amphibalanus amphitrite]|uniref:nascent polypeptide-associated complex subunit alpha, muscle-specific form-like isoform X2 n=1 Tax=Amphibalanus amphitrite TaxID=1232801 RepID=UPI001C9237DF|nr:nascent polypeptide-associated complex subunit alpha, muscle-specific form-like isoform X2 [Amphibalanus amphitrite]
MAYVNVASWTSDQVAEWIKGLSDHEAMQSYARHLQAANITGSRLLQLRPGELRQLHITRVGHQEVILAAISRLQTLHFTLNSENLQQLAMRLCSKARCLYNELCREQPPVAPGGRQRVTVPILEAVTDTMTSVKDIIGWLNTAPFDGQDQFTEMKSRILEPSIELVINAQRDSFAVRPVDGIRAASKQLADVCDSVIQDCCDSLSLLPAPLLIMTIKRKPDEPLGLHIVRAISGVPIITGVKFQSPAHHCGKLEEGDEIVQVNYQTVVGWQLGKVIDLLQDKESGTDVYLTVKKRPKHSNLIDQVYFKQFRLPNKKRTPYRWNSSPRPDLLASLPKITLPPKLSSPEALEAELTPQPSSDSDSEAFLPEAGSAAASPTSVRHYLPKPRPTLQRRATVTGASPTSRRPPASIEQLWQLRSAGRRGATASRSPSPGSGGSPPPSPLMPLTASRPLTCIGGRESLEVRAAPLWPPGSSDSLPARPPPPRPPGADSGRRRAGPVPEQPTRPAPRTSVSSLPEQAERTPPPPPADKPRLEKTQSAPAYDVGRREESFERVLRELPRRPAIEEETDSDTNADGDAGSTTTNGCDDGGDSGPLAAPAPAAAAPASVRAELPLTRAAPAEPTPSAPVPAPSVCPTPGTQPFGPAAGAGAGPVSAEKDLQNSEHSDSPAPLSTVSEATYESGSPIELEVPTESEAAEPNSLPEPGSNTPPDVGEEEATKTPQETPEEVAEGTPNTESSEAPRAEWPSGRSAPSDGPADGSAAVHPTVLLLSGATEDESSSDMPSALKDASPLREMIEKMDVAFRGLKTSLSDLSRPEGSPLTPDGAPPAQPGSRGGPAVLLRQHSRLSFKGRRVSCRDLGQGDCQGWLHMKKEGRGFLHADKWAKRWLVLHGHKLYGYKDKESQQAETLISLPGYQVSPANDIRSKRHAFRVYSNERSVVFASDSQLDMTKWMNKMGLSAIAYDSTKTFTTGGFSRPDRDGTHVDMYFSDTDDEDSKKRTPLKRPPMQRGRVTPSPTSSLDRARQKLRNWRTGSPVPSAGSLSSLSSLGSERPAIKKKPSLRFLARVRRDSGQSAASVSSVVSTEGQRRASQPETSGDRVKEVITPQKSAPLSENDLRRLASPDSTPSAPIENPPSPSAPTPTPAAPTVRRAATPPAVPAKPASVAAAAAANRHAGHTSAPVSVTARWLASPEDPRRTCRPVSQPAAGRAQRPVPPPRRPRSRDQTPDYVNWRLPGGPSTSTPAAGASSRQTETVIRIGAGGRTERIEQRERRPAAARSVESSRGPTAEGRLVASLVSGTHTVPRPAAALRRAASADTDRQDLPGYMRPTISSRAGRHSDGRLRPEERRPPLSKQRSVSTSGLSSATLPSGKRRASVASDQPVRAASENGGSLPRRPPPSRPRGHTLTRAASEGPPERTATSPTRAGLERTSEPPLGGAIPEETVARVTSEPVTVATTGSSPAHPVARPVTVTVSHGTTVDTGVGQSDERLLSPGSSRRGGSAPTRPLSPPDDPRRLKKTSQYECPSWSPMARHAEEARMRFAFEMDLDGGGDDVFEPAGVSRPRPPPRLAKSASASQVSMGSGRERPSITIQVQSEGAAIGAEEPRTPRKPAMGVSMIGKQRRTPTSTSSSPHFVFPSAPLSPSGSPSPGPGAETTGISRGIAAHGTLSPPPALAKSQTSPALGWGLRVLPRYGLQYPPVFTPDTYSLEQMSGSAAETASLGPAWADRCYADSATQTEAGRAEGAASLAPPTSTTGQAGRGGLHQ